MRNGNYITDNENFEYMTTITIVCNQSYSVSTNSPDAMTCTQNKYGQMVWQPPYVPRCYRKYFLLIYSYIEEYIKKLSIEQNIILRVMLVTSDMYIWGVHGGRRHAPKVYEIVRKLVTELVMLKEI